MSTPTLPTRTITRTLELGALCDPVSKQLAGLLPEEDLAQFDHMADAITACAIHGLIGEAEVHRARGRLLKRVEKALAA